MTKSSILLIAAATLAGAFSLVACDEENDGLETPDADDARQERRDDTHRPGDASQPGAVRPGGPVRTDGDLTKPSDNTAHNKEIDKTPFDQSEKPEDIQITAAIRKAILAADGMSSSAGNVKIITANGVVAVRGVVKSQAELDAIRNIVDNTPGVTSADIQLGVEPD